jgi:hypothetical protein
MSSEALINSIGDLLKELERTNQPLGFMLLFFPSALLHVRTQEQGTILEIDSTPSHIPNLSVSSSWTSQLLELWQMLMIYKLWILRYFVH